MIGSMTAPGASPGTPATNPEAVPAPARGTASRPVRKRGTVARWIAASLLVVVATFTLIALNGTTPSAREPLHPESASPEGAKALVQVLTDHGVPVHLAQGREASLSLLSTAGESTLVMTAPTVQSDAAIANIKELVAAADHTVFLVADEMVLADFGLGEISSSTTEDLVSESGNTSCPKGRFAAVGEVWVQVFFTTEPGVQGCFTNTDGESALLVSPNSINSNSGATISMIDASEMFDNAHLAQDGNAALAFALLGDTDQVVWYQASPEDLAADRVGTLAALTPKWVTPVMILLLLTAIVAAVWRGRRFGPLVEEHLPVTVRASETMIGRARLAARNGDSTHAAHSLREGATRRLARTIGLPRTATPEQVARALPDEPTLMLLLTGPLPSTDAELVSFARTLGAILDRLNPLPSAPQTAPKPPISPEERSTQ